MSSQTPPAGAGSAPPPSGAPTPPAPPQPKQKVFKVASKHDWCTTVATSEAEARQKWHEFFGIKGSDHEVEVTATSDKPGLHSGQKTCDTTMLGGEKPKV